MEANSNYLFTIVITIYNSELWLRTAIESIINQSIYFKNIQLILVDDGSTDDSIKICEEYKNKYAENIEIILKKNGGVASARNQAIKYIKGKYVEFLDSDDFLSNDVLEKVYDFFEKNKKEIDIVSIPMYYFEGRTGEHYLNNKFKKGNRIVNLNKDWQDIFIHINSVFIKSETIKKYRFDEDLVTCEDGKILIQILLEKQMYGVIVGCQYNYRLRNNKSSLSQIARKNKDWFIKQILNYPLWIYNYCNITIGYIPNFVKYTIASHLQWRFKEKNKNSDLLKEDEKLIYNYLLIMSVQYIDDFIIDRLTQMTKEEKEIMKAIK